jgi:glycosyltransferase involved in cell wall biosynthesis
MAVLEAVRAGCRPLLPNRLSYPEIFPKDFLYDDEAFIDRFIETLDRKRLPKDWSKELTKNFSWESLADKYAALLLEKKKARG